MNRISIGTHAPCLDAAAAGYADRYDPDTHFDRWYTDATADQLLRHIDGGDRVLELGSATGRMTQALAASGASVLGVERSIDYLRLANMRSIPRARYELDDVEHWVTENRRSRSASFDHILATNIVHELHDLPSLFDGCRELLTATGTMHLTLQNPASIHRLTGRAIGVVKDLCEVTAEGQDLLTLRIYDVQELTDLMSGAGLDVVARSGVMLKPFPNAEMERLSDRQIEGLIAVGASFPDNCAMNYLIARRADVPI